MKIVYLLDDFPPKNYSSASILTFNLAKQMLKLGNEVFVITRTNNKKEQGEEIINQIKIFRIYSNYPLIFRHWIAIFNFQIVFKVKKILKNLRPDVCHFQHIHQYLSYYCLKLASKYSEKVFITAHDVMFFHYGKLMPKNGNIFYKLSIFEQIKEAGKLYNPFRNLFIRHYLKYADKIFTVSDALKKILEINRIYNIKTIYNGIDVEDWQINKDRLEKFKNKYRLSEKKTILFGGRISEAKGGGVILQAMVSAVKEINNIVLLVVGENKFYIPQMMELVKRLKLDKNIIFLGKLNREEMKLVNNLSDISVVPSICFDSFPTTNLEAMACKKPVIGTIFGGTQELVQNGVTGYVVNPLNVELMAEKIIYLFKNPQKAKQFGESGYERVKECFSLSLQADKTFKYYKGIINSFD